MAYTKNSFKTPFSIEELSKSSRNQDSKQTEAIIVSHVGIYSQIPPTSNKRKRETTDCEYNNLDSRIISSPSSCSDDSDNSDQPRKKSRATFTNTQVTELEKYYSYYKYLQIEDRPLLSKRLNLSQTQIKWWFQNRRMKEKRQIITSGKSAEMSQFVGVGKPGSRVINTNHQSLVSNHQLNPAQPQILHQMSLYGQMLPAVYPNYNPYASSNVCF